MFVFIHERKVGIPEDYPFPLSTSSAWDVLREHLWNVELRERGLPIVSFLKVRCFIGQWQISVVLGYEKKESGGSSESTPAAS